MPLVPDARIPLIRRRRDRARNLAFLGFGLMFFGVIIARFGNITLFQWRQVDAAALLGYVVGLAGSAMLAGGLGLFVVGSGVWALRAWQLHRLADPWAYDPDLDGPDPHKRHDLDDSYEDVDPPAKP